MLELFERRPSKDEDVDEINKLRQDLNGKETLLKRAEEAMDYYKNILINNEESYNKYFGNAPKIGTIDPLKKATPQQDERKNNKVLYYLTLI